MKNKVGKVLSLLSFLLIPGLVYADDLTDLGIIETLMTHLMLSIHSAAFFCWPMSMILKEDSAEQKKIFWKIFLGRAIIVIVLAIMIPTVSVTLDVISIFAGGFIGFPLSSVINSKRRKKAMADLSSINNNGNADVICHVCNTSVMAGSEFCTFCGAKLPVGDKTVTLGKNGKSVTLPLASAGKPLNAYKIFGYNFTADQMVDEVIRKEIAKNGVESNVSIGSVERKKNIFSIIYAVILLICVSLFFFHSHIGVLILVFVIVTLIYFNSIRNYNLVKFLQKEVKSRPDEKIGYIVSSVMADKVSTGKYKTMRLVAMVVAIVIPLLIFSTPHVIYEYDKNLEGYVIRFYTIGWLKNDKEIEVPKEYKDKNVVGIRGDVFANVKTLEKVVLPDTIKEIRGGAFTNASNLEEINIPDGITEIKGNTFEGCDLKEITIPDSVTRIGGHAFRDNSNLKTVNISAKSKLKEIGSSAFRNCYELEEIYLPKGVSINERAFKDSGTNVKEYTESGIVFQDEYEYDTYVYLQIGESEEINKYNDDALTQGYTVRLDKVEGEYGDYVFAISILKETGGAVTFPLYRGSEYFIVSEYDIVVEVTDDYVFDTYSNRVALNIYYN